MGAAVKLLGKVAAGCVEAETPKCDAKWSSALVASRIKGSPAQANMSTSLRSALCLAGNPNVAGAASLFPLRNDLAQEFRPSHLSDSTDLFNPSFDVRGVLYQGGVEAHLTFTVEQAPNGDWSLFQVTPTTGYPGIRIDDPKVTLAIATSTLQSLTSRRIKSGLPWEPGVVVAGSRVVEALRELIGQAQ